jgi:hypothetical protein
MFTLFLSYASVCFALKHAEHCIEKINILRMDNKKGKAIPLQALTSP